MKTDTQIDTPLGADPAFLSRLTDGIEVHVAPHLFDALNVKGLVRRTDGVLEPQRDEEGIWIIELQAQPDPPQEILKMLVWRWSRSPLVNACFRCPCELGASRQAMTGDDRSSDRQH